MMSHIKYWGVICALVVLATMAQAEETKYEAGKHYKVLSKPQPVLADGKLHVEEAFWYGCPHCFQLEKNLKPWKADLPSDVAFNNIPAMFGRAWIAHAHLYYVADSLGLLPKLHDAIFHAVHVDKKRLLDKSDQRDFLVAQAGIKEEDFDKAYQSFTVKSRMKQGGMRVQNFQLDGVPALIVQGKYVVSASSAGGQQNMIKVVNYLLQKERSARP